MNMKIENLSEYCNKNEKIGIFCRDIQIKTIFDSNSNKLFTHKHIIFFLEESIKRIIASEHLLIDATFVFPKTYSETIIIMYFDNLINKMIPGIYIVSNNKNYKGYLTIFIYIKTYILSMVKNDKKKIKWLSFTSDYEIGLYTAFQKAFDFIENLVHYGCYFHYMKNIRKFLVSNKYTNKENTDKYNYIINEVSELPFKKNIDKSIHKEINKSFKNKIYKDFKEYFIKQWIPYFKNKILLLRGVNIKFRTNNSLENFNRIFKHNIKMKNNMELISFVDNLINLSTDQINFYKSNINQQQKKINIYENDCLYNEDIKTVLEELEEPDNNEITKEEIENNNSNYSSIEKINNDDSIIDNLNSLNNKKGFLNKYNSCSFDSFISIFIFSIKPYIDINYNIDNYNYIYKKENNNLLNNYELYLKLINIINQNIAINFVNFYDIYEKFIHDNNYNLFNLQNNEYHCFVPAVINYRNFYNNKIFGIIYKINHFCTGKCKYGGGCEEEKITGPFIDIPEIAYKDNRIDNIEKLFKEYIFIDIHTICTEEICAEKKDNDIQYYIKKYTIIAMPLILTINTNLNEFDSMVDNKQFINALFKNKIELFGANYKLIGLMTQPYENHFKSYFINLNDKYDNSINKWFSFDDFKGIYIELKNQYITIDNIRSSEGICLLIYLKIK